MAAVEAAGAGAAVVLFDRAGPGATLLRTGGGRCNLTNAVFEARILAASYPRGGLFLLSAFSRFAVRETMEWFAARGLPLVQEDEGRVFPSSGKAADVRAVLLELAGRLEVRVRGGTAVRRVERTGQGFRVVTGGGKAGDAPAAAFDALVLATGGDLSNPEGSGYRLAASLGHSMTPLAPSLAALLVAEQWARGLAGLSLPLARARAARGGKRVADEEGALLFTHRGISGPLAFRLSARAAFLPLSPEEPLPVTVSVAPDLTPSQAEEQLAAAAAARPRQAVLTALGSLAPRSLGIAVLRLAGVDPATAGSQLPRAGRRAIAHLLCGLPLTVTGREKGSEMVCAGGIPLDEVNPVTMESKIVPGLFLCGEILDIDGFTGGFNLQAAWSTGHLAGLGAAAAAGPRAT
jgi:predicted Rossmann fold flavoprotein